MADTLESLEIQVRHSASGAADEINRVVGAVRSLSRALTAALPKLQQYNSLMGSMAGNASANVNVNPTAQIVEALNNLSRAANRAQSATSNTARGVRTLTKEAKKSKGPLDNFIASLKRIAYYRLIRSIIKAITKAFTEGLEKAYLFSQQMTTGSARFAQSLDRIKAETNQMRGQIGSAFISLLAAIEPVLIRLADLVTKVADTFAQLFAAFTGTTYLRAGQTVSRWADDTNRGAAAAREWKNQLLGFDEINRLNEPSSSGRNSDNPLEGYTMQDTPINEVYLRIVQTLRDLVNSIDFEPLRKSWARLTESVKEFSNVVLKYLKEAWDKVLTPLAKWTFEKLLPVTITLVAAAFGFLAKVLKRLEPLATWLWENFLQPIASWTGDAITSALQDLTDVLEKLGDVLDGNVSLEEFINSLSNSEKYMLGFSAGLIIFGATLAAVNIGKAIATFLTLPLVKFALVAFFAYAGFKTLSDGIEIFRDSGEMMGEAATKIAAGAASILLAIGLLGAPMAFIPALVLGGIAFIESKWDTIPEHIRGVITEIEEAVAMALLACGAIIAFSGVNIPLGIALMAGGFALSQHANLHWGSLSDDVKQVIVDVEKIVSEALLVVGAILTFSGNLAVGIPILAAGAIGLAISNSHESGSVREMISKTLADIFAIGGMLLVGMGLILLFTGNIPLGLTLLVGGIAAMGIGGMAGGSNPLLEMVQGCLDAIWAAFTGWINTLESAVDDAINRIRNWLGLDAPGGPINHHSGSFASGGFPNEGEMFIAREAGPEMVGAIGGRTAVANNDQIVESIRLGVYDAVSAAMTQNSSSGRQDIRIYLDSREIKAGQQRLNRAWGV